MGSGQSLIPQQYSVI